MVQTVIASTTEVDFGNANIEVEIAPPTAGELKEYRGNRNTDVVLPAGAYSIFVQHIEPAGGTIQVNGQDYAFNEIYSSEVRFDRADNRQDFVGQVSIVANSKNYALRVEYPSDHPFDPSTL